MINSIISQTSTYCRSPDLPSSSTSFPTPTAVKCTISSSSGNTVYGDLCDLPFFYNGQRCVEDTVFLAALHSNQRNVVKKNLRKENEKKQNNSSERHFNIPLWPFCFNELIDSACSNDHLRASSAILYVHILFSFFSPGFLLCFVSRYDQATTDYNGVNSCPTVTAWDKSADASYWGPASCQDATCVTS